MSGKKKGKEDGFPTTPTQNSKRSKIDLTLSPDLKSDISLSADNAFEGSFLGIDFKLNREQVRPLLLGPAATIDEKQDLWISSSVVDMCISSAIQRSGNEGLVHCSPCGIFECLNLESTVLKIGSAKKAWKSLRDQCKNKVCIQAVNAFSHFSLFFFQFDDTWAGKGPFIFHLNTMHGNHSDPRNYITRLLHLI